MTIFPVAQSNVPVPPLQPALEKSTPKSVVSPSLLLLGFAAVSFLCVFLFLAMNSYYPLLVPLAIVVGSIIVIYPTALIFLFFSAFFLGSHLIERWDLFFIDLPHLFIPLILLGFFSQYLSSSRADSDSIQIPKSVIIVLLLFLFSVFISFILNSAFNSFGQNMLSLWYLLNLVFLVLAACFFSQRWVKNLKTKIISVIIFLSAMEIPVIIGQIMQLKDYSMLSLRTITGTFSTHHSMLANMTTFSLGFSLFGFLDTSNLKKKALYGVLTFIFLNMIIFSGGRSNLIGIFCAGIVIILLRLRPKPIHVLYILSFLFMAVLIFEFSPLHNIFTETLHSRETGTFDMSSLGRFYVLRGALDHFWKAPLIEKIFGTGMANLKTIQFPFFIFTVKHVQGAHNNFLHVLMETGICGLILFLTFYIVVLVLLYKQGKCDHLALSYFFITLALLISGITQETFWFQPAFGLFWLFHTSLLALIINANPKKQPYE
jgi:O-antigen ligase